MKKPILLIISIILLMLTVIFTLQNASTVQIYFFTWEGTASLALLLSITLAVGILTALIILIPVIVHLKQSVNQRRTEKETPLKDGLPNDSK